MRPTSRIRLAYIYDHAIETWLGVAAVVSGANFLLTPQQFERTPLGQALHPWDYGWNALYTLGGAAVCAGLVALRPRYEAAGLCLLASAFTINLAATIAVLGSRALGGETVLLLLVVACVMRLRRLVTL